MAVTTSDKRNALLLNLHSEPQGNLNFNKLCRLCLSENDVDIPVFNFVDKSDEYGNLTLSERIMLCTSLTVEKNDGLPSNICTMCFNQVHRTISFRQLCKQSDQTLRRYLKNIAERMKDDVENEMISSKDDLQIDVPKEPQLNNLNDICIEKNDLNYVWFDATSCTVNTDDFNNNGDNIINFFDDSLSTSLKISYKIGDNTIDKEQQIESDDKSISPTENNREIDLKKQILIKKIIKNDEHKKKTTIFACDICAKICNSHSSLHYHKLKHSDNKPHKCKFCEKTFYQKCTLIKHERVHTGEKPYTCDKCGKSFNQESNLKFHMTSHGGEKIFCCHICGKVFTLGHNLNEHLKIHNNTRKRLFDCDLCNKSFYHRSHLTNHVNSHNGIKPYTCDICGKNFVKNSYLKQHKRIHTGEKPYKCKVCDKLFASSSNLTAHARLHNKQFNFCCKICDKRFRNKTKYNNHINIFHKNDISTVGNSDNGNQIIILNSNNNKNLSQSMTNFFANAVLYPLQ